MSDIILYYVITLCYAILLYCIISCASASADEVREVQRVVAIFRMCLLCEGLQGMCLLCEGLKGMFLRRTRYPLG